MVKEWLQMKIAKIEGEGLDFSKWGIFMFFEARRSDAVRRVGK